MCSKYYSRVFIILFCLINIDVKGYKRRYCINKGQKDTKLVIDQDAGADDAFAIFVALLYEKYFCGPTVVAITTSHGNVDEPQAYRNTQRILSIANRRDIPIYRGSNESLLRNYPSDEFFGKDGLGDNGYGDSCKTTPARAGHASLALIELSKKYNGQLVIITLGALTNIALAVRLDPKFIRRLSHLYIAAGNIKNDTSLNPEFNAKADVEAYYIVVQNACPDFVTLIPFNQVKQSLNISKCWRTQIFGRINTTLVRALNAYEEISLSKIKSWSLLDPAAMSLVLDKSLITATDYSDHSIILTGFIKTDALEIIYNLLPEKSKHLYEKAYDEFWGSVVPESARNNKTKLVIDNDAGGDDAMAIFLALLNEKFDDGPELIALTTTNGNTIEENVNVNNQRILKVAKRQDVPIFRGAQKSLLSTPTTGDFYGTDGLGDNYEVLSDLVEAKNKSAVNALLELSKTYEGELIVVTLGTVTNIAIAISLDSDFMKRLKHLYVAAGHIHSDRYPYAEFNAHMDVEGYHIIAKAATPDKVTMFPYSQAIDSLSIDKEWRLNVFGAIDTDIVRAQNLYEKISMNRYETWHALDPAMVAVAVNPGLIDEIRYSKNCIVLCGEDRGLNTNTFVNPDKANVRIIYAVKMEEYKMFLVKIFSADETVPKNSIVT